MCAVTSTVERVTRFRELHHAFLAQGGESGASSD
jgi:hypothetical protein